MIVDAGPVTFPCNLLRQIAISAVVDCYLETRALNKIAEGRRSIVDHLQVVNRFAFESQTSGNPMLLYAALNQVWQG